MIQNNIVQDESGDIYVVVKYFFSSKFLSLFIIRFYTNLFNFTPFRPT